eukprot:10827566-Karenia_brevis.AAC.1
MLKEITFRIQEFDLRWKESSLEILPGGCFTDEFDYCFTITQDRQAYTYKVKSDVVLLGELLDRRGSTSASMHHRQNTAN